MSWLQLRNRSERGSLWSYRSGSITAEHIDTDSDDEEDNEEDDDNDSDDDDDDDGDESEGGDGEESDDGSDNDVRSDYSAADDGNGVSVARKADEVNGSSNQSGEETREHLQELRVVELKDRLKEKGLKVGGRKDELINRLMEREAEVVDDGNEENDLQRLTITVLKDRLRKRGLNVGGKKAELIARLLGREKSREKKWKGSKARALLTRLVLDDKSWVHTMSPEDIHKSQSIFESFPLPKFKEYLGTIQKSVAIVKETVKVNEKEVWQDLAEFPREATNDRGYPFWDTHSARALLASDVRDGSANEMKPKELWYTRDEYQCFPLGVFRDHVHQEKRRQRELPGSIHRRNKKAQKMHEAEVNAMKDEWDQQIHAKEMDNICKRWELLQPNRKNDEE